MPDNFYPKQRAEDAYRRGLNDIDPMRHRVRAGEHIETSMEDRRNLERRERRRSRRSSR